MSARKSKRERNIKSAIFIFIAFFVMFLSVFVRWWNGRISDRGLTSDFRVAVLNGTGRDGLAMKTALELRKMGVDVLIVDNAENFNFTETLIVDRRNKPELVEQFSRMIGSPRIVKQFNSQSMVDATLIIGEDREGLKIGSNGLK